MKNSWKTFCISKWNLTPFKNRFSVVWSASQHFVAQILDIQYLVARNLLGFLKQSIEKPYQQVLVEWRTEEFLKAEVGVRVYVFGVYNISMHFSHVNRFWGLFIRGKCKKYFWIWKNFLREKFLFSTLSHGNFILTFVAPYQYKKPNSHSGMRLPKPVSMSSNTK